METRIKKEIQTVHANALIALLLSKKELAETSIQSAHVIEEQSKKFQFFFFFF
jgi:hypothetical protein